MSQAKVHSLYRWLSEPSVVTLCGMTDYEDLLVSNHREKVTCVRCIHVYDKHSTRHNIVQSSKCPKCKGAMDEIEC